MDDLARVTSVLNAYPEVRLALVFGSVAAGKAKADSDLDIAVAGGRALSAAQQMALIGDLAGASGRPVDLIDLASVGEPLLGEILAKGRRLLGSDTDYARLITRHLLDAADFLPLRSRILEERRNRWIAG